MKNLKKLMFFLGLASSAAVCIYAADKFIEAKEKISAENKCIAEQVNAQVPRNEAGELCRD